MSQPHSYLRPLKLRKITTCFIFLKSKLLLLLCVHFNNVEIE